MDKVSLININPHWDRTNVGAMICPYCHWDGPLYHCLSKQGSPFPGCPSCEAVLDDPITQYKGQKVAA